MLPLIWSLGHSRSALLDATLDGVAAIDEFKRMHFMSPYTYEVPCCIHPDRDHDVYVLVRLLFGRTVYPCSTMSSSTRLDCRPRDLRCATSS